MTVVACYWVYLSLFFIQTKHVLYLNEYFWIGLFRPCYTSMQDLLCLRVPYMSTFRCLIS
jgi:hypothetical protein